MSNSTNEKLKYFLYTRKSSESEDRQVQSIDDQIKVLKDQAKKLNLEVVEVFTESRSAKKPYNRPVFAEMIQRIEKGEAKGILCWKLDRLARNPVDGGAITWMLQNSIIEQIKTYDRTFCPTDNVLMISIEFGMANQYIIDLRKNCKRGMEGRAERGWLPSLAPAGYLNDRNEHTIIEDPNHFHLIRTMWDMMLTGAYSPEQIRKVANTEWGYRTRKFKRQGGTEMPLCNMYKLFTNIFYTGMFEWSGKLYNGKHRSMITVEEFDRVQILLGKKGRPRPKTHQFAYTGILHCGECSGMITATEKQKLVKTTGLFKTYVYYHCTKKKKGIKCSQSPVTLKELEDQIAERLKEWTIDDSFLKFTLALIKEDASNEIEVAEKAEEMRRQSLAVSERELESLTKMRYRELIDDDAFIAERDVIKKKIIRLRQQLLNQENRTKSLNESTSRAFIFAAGALEKLRKGTIHEKKEVLIALGSNCSIKDKKLFIQEAEWVNVMQQGVPLLKTAYKPLELVENPYLPMVKSQILAFNETLRATLQDVRKALSHMANSEKDIPVVQQISPTETASEQSNTSLLQAKNSPCNAPEIFDG